MRVLILPKIKIQNANALSSPFTIGFPAMTVWLGFTHALELKLRQIGFDNIIFLATAVVNHDFSLKTYKADDDYNYSIIGTANPLDKEGNRTAFIEEPRCNLEVSLIIEFEGNISEMEEEGASARILDCISKMKVGGGDILSLNNPDVKLIDDEGSTLKLLKSLMPSYAIIERRELMIDAMKTGMDALDALLSFLTIDHASEQLDENNVKWFSQKKAQGWLVPIATGFHGISDIHKAENQRDPDVNHRFAESVVTLGEFIMLHKVKSLDDILWRTYYDSAKDLYICQQDKQHQ